MPTDHAADPLDPRDLPPPAVPRRRSIVDLAEQLLVEEGYEALDPERVAAAGGLAVRTVRRAFPTAAALAVAAVVGDLGPPRPAADDRPDATVDRWRADVEQRAERVVRPLLSLLAGTAPENVVDEVHRRLVGPTGMALAAVTPQWSTDEREQRRVSTWAACLTAAATRLGRVDEAPLLVAFAERVPPG